MKLRKDDMRALWNQIDGQTLLDFTGEGGGGGARIWIVNNVSLNCTVMMVV